MFAHAPAEEAPAVERLANKQTNISGFAAYVQINDKGFSEFIKLCVGSNALDLTETQSIAFPLVFSAAFPPSLK